MMAYTPVNKRDLALACMISLTATRSCHLFCNTRYLAFTASCLDLSGLGGSSALSSLSLLLCVVAVVDITAAAVFVVGAGDTEADD